MSESSYSPFSKGGRILEPTSFEAGYGARRRPLDNEIDRLHSFFFPL